MPSLYNIIDFNTNTTIQTLASNKVNVIQVEGSSDLRARLPKLNADTTASGQLTGGVSFNYNSSDLMVKNGVLHELDGILYPLTSYPRNFTIVNECEKEISIFQTSGGNKLSIPNIITNNGRESLYENINFSTDLPFGMGYAVYFKPSDVGGWIDFILRDVTPGKYQIYTSYRKDKYASTNVNVYFRNNLTEFNYKSQLIFPALDLAADSVAVPGRTKKAFISEFNQTEYQKAVLDIIENRNLYKKNTMSAATKFFSLKDGVERYAKVYNSF